jgi:hypothetical protein
LQISNAFWTPTVAFRCCAHKDAASAHLTTLSLQMRPAQTPAPILATARWLATYLPEGSALAVDAVSTVRSLHFRDRMSTMSRILAMQPETHSVYTTEPSTVPGDEAFVHGRSLIALTLNIADVSTCPPLLCPDISGTVADSSGFGSHQGSDCCQQSRRIRCS